MDGHLQRERGRWQTVVSKHGVLVVRPIKLKGRAVTQYDCMACVGAVGGVLLLDESSEGQLMAAQSNGWSRLTKPWPGLDEFGVVLLWPLLLLNAPQHTGVTAPPHVPCSECLGIIGKPWW